MWVGMLGAHEAALPQTSGLPHLDARSVGETAERAVLSLSLPRNEAFTALYNYLAVDEPAVHLMPLHFLPRSSRRGVEHDFLHPLGVAAKLEYVRSRWIDEIVDQGSTESWLAVHRLHEALVELIIARYSEVLHGREAVKFFQTLSGLYALHTVSVAVDECRPRHALASLTREAYMAQVRTRNGAFRASVDATILLSGAAAETLRIARESWHLWVLGAQLYDDALDVEEDFESGNQTWTVARTFADLDGGSTTDLRPDQDSFYEAALVGGALEETFSWAESCFRAAAHLAEDEFPSWSALQRACVTQTSALRRDLAALATAIARR